MENRGEQVSFKLGVWIRELGSVVKGSLKQGCIELGIGENEGVQLGSVEQREGVGECGAGEC